MNCQNDRIRCHITAFIRPSSPKPPSFHTFESYSVHEDPSLHTEDVIFFTDLFQCLFRCSIKFTLTLILVRTFGSIAA